MSALAERLSEISFILHSDVPNYSEQWNTKIKIEKDEICVTWDNANTIGAKFYGLQEHAFKINKEDLITVVSSPKFDIPNEDDLTSLSQYPELIVKHKDPYKVVESFTSIFRNGSSYWIRALAKLLQEEYNIEIDQEEINEE